MEQDYRGFSGTTEIELLFELSMRAAPPITCKLLVIDSVYMTRVALGIAIL